MTTIITLEEFKAYAGISSPNKDDQINPLLVPATEMVQNYLKIDFTSLDLDTPAVKRVTEKFLTTENQPEYLLDTYDTEVVSVVLEGLQGRQAPELTADDWFADTRIGKITLLFNPSDTYFCVVEYDTTKSPTELVKLAACMLVDYWLQKDFNSAVAASGQSVTYTPVRVLPKHIENILNTYRTL